MVLCRLLSLCCFIVGGKRHRLLGQVGQLSALSGFLGLGGLVIGGECCSLLSQGADLPLHDVEALALRRLLCLRRFIVGGEACRLLSQVGQLGALVDFLRLGGLVVGGQGRCLLVQGSDLPLHDVEALALRCLLCLRRFIVGGKSLGLLGEGSELQRQTG